MAKLGEVFAKQLERAGIDVTGEAYKEIVGVQVEVPEEADTALNTKLHTFEQTTDPSRLPGTKQHYFGVAFSIFDKKIKDVAIANGFPIEDFKFDENFGTNNRLDLLTRKLAEKAEEAKTTGAPEKVQNELKELREKYQLLEQEKAAEVEKVKNEFLTREENAFLDKLIEDGDLPGYVKSMSPQIRRQQMKQWLEDEKAIVLNKDGNFGLYSKHAPDVEYSEGGTGVSIEAKVAAIKAQKDWLVVSAPAGGEKKETNKTVTTTDAPGAEQILSTTQRLKQEFLSA